jgi:quercetin dioxygenase-like cupin family protein
VPGRPACTATLTRERVTVVSGHICVRVGDEEREYGPGESAFLPRGVWHDFWVLGDEPGEIDAILDHWAAYRPWAGYQRPTF